MAATRKQIFHLNTPPKDKYLAAPPSYFEPTDKVVTWTVRMYDHVLIMPELTLLVEKFYYEN